MVEETAYDSEGKINPYKAEKKTKRKRRGVDFLKEIS